MIRSRKALRSKLIWRMPNVVGRKIYSSASMATRQIGNGSASRNISYKLPEGVTCPWETLSLRDWYGAISGVLGREFLWPFGMYELMGLPNGEYGEVGGARVGK